MSSNMLPDTAAFRICQNIVKDTMPDIKQDIDRLGLDGFTWLAGQPDSIRFKDIFFKTYLAKKYQYKLNIPLKSDFHRFPETSLLRYMWYLQRSSITKSWTILSWEKKVYMKVPVFCWRAPWFFATFSTIISTNGKFWVWVGGLNIWDPLMKKNVTWHYYRIPKPQTQTNNVDNLPK